MNSNEDKDDGDKSEKKDLGTKPMSTAIILFEPPARHQAAEARRNVALRKLTQRLKRPYRSLQDLLDESVAWQGNRPDDQPVQQSLHKAWIGFSGHESNNLTINAQTDVPRRTSRKKAKSLKKTIEFLRPVNLSLGLKEEPPGFGSVATRAKGSTAKESLNDEKDESNLTNACSKESTEEDASLSLLGPTSETDYALEADSVGVLGVGIDDRDIELEEEEEKEDDKESETENDVESPSVGAHLRFVDDALRQVLSGSLDRVIPPTKKVVRIFTSSTFTDTTLERNCLMERVYPKLKEYCMERYGLDFQVVDMRWGVRDESTDDHMTTDLCLKEIDNCQRLSLGPNFVVFLGQKYGYRPIPSALRADIMESLRAVVEELQLEDRQLIEQWYKKEENAVPPVYILQPISSILVNFNNKRVQRLMEKDQWTWWGIMEKLQKLLRRGAAELHSRGLINEDQMHDFIMSEREVRRGIIEAVDPTRHCLAYVRYIAGIDTSEAGSKLARNYVDMIGNEVDTEAERLLSFLRDDLLPTKLPSTNIVRYNVEWSEKGGISIETHSEYLEQFCNVFYRDVCKLIDIAAEEQTHYGDFDKIFSQVHHHQLLCLALSKNFSGRDEILEKIKEYLKGNSTEPLILWGEGGCGKTSIMAKAFSMLKLWNSEEDEEGEDPPQSDSNSSLKVIRFLGTSLDSSTVVPLLTSLSQQINFYYGDCLDDSLPQDLMSLSLHFKNLLSLATAQRPLFLFLDSMDQLTTSGGSHNLSWFPFLLPKYCKVVASVPKERYALVEKLKKFMGSETENFLEVSSLGREQGLQVVRSLLANANRTLNAKQWKIVEKMAENCSEPLFLKMLSGVVSKWRSYELSNLSNLAVNTHDAIMKLFEKTENIHGKMLVSHAFGYITVSKRGVTEAELEDLLSLDEAVLNDVYQYHLPPVRRIPPLLWTRIRSDLSDYVSEREADGVNVINWSHTKFADATRERYFKNLNVLSETHSLMADYFIGIWGGVSKPFQYSDLQCQRFELDTAHGSCDRKVSEQPLYFIDKRKRISRSASINSAASDAAPITRYNLRKLNEQPHHLIKSRRCRELYELILFNFKWLHAKLSATSVQSVVEDYDDALATLKCDQEAIKLVRDSLKLSASVVEQRPDMLAPQLTGRLLPLCSQYELIRSLLRQCDVDGIALNALTPCYNCFQTPGGPLEISLEGHRFAPFGVCITSDSRFLVSASNKFIVWDLNKMQTVRQSGIGTLGIVMQMTLTADDARAVAYTNNGQILIYMVLTGETNLIDNGYLEGSSEELTGVATNDHVFAVWSPLNWFVFGFDGTLLSSNACPKTVEGGNVVHLYLGLETKIDHRLVWKYGYESGVPSVIKMFLSPTRSSLKDDRSIDFPFHSGIAMTKDRRTIYVCKGEGNSLVKKYSLAEGGNFKWKEMKAFFDESNGNGNSRIYSLFLSDDESMLGVIRVNKFVVWSLADRAGESRPVTLYLPKDVRNFPRKICTDETAVFSKGNDFLMAPIRQVLYVWETDSGTLVNVLDAHFRRILKVRPILVEAHSSTGGDGSSAEQQIQQQQQLQDDSSRHKFVTTSLDKSIKVWNLKFIREHIYNINCHEKQIEQITCVNSSAGWLAVTTTRNCVGVWNLDTGKLVTSLTGASVSPIVTHSSATSGGDVIFGIESGRLIAWDVTDFKMIKPDLGQPSSSPSSAATSAEEYTEEACSVKQMCVAPDDKHIILVKTYCSDEGVAFLEKRKIPTLALDYRIKYRCRPSHHRSVVFSSDGAFLVVPASTCPPQAKQVSPGDSIKVFSFETGQKISSSTLKYRRYRELQKIVAMPNKPSRVALIDAEKGNLWDLRRKALVRSVYKWSGQCSRDGRFGLTDPSMGGLEVIDLKTESTVHVLVPRPAEGLHPDNKAGFTLNDEHVYFYHSAKRSIRVFRLADGCKIADYKVHAEITANVAVAHDSMSLVIGATDGSLVVLAIGDPRSSRHTEFVIEKRRSYYT